MKTAIKDLASGEVIYNERLRKASAGTMTFDEVFLGFAGMTNGMVCRLAGTQRSSPGHRII